LPFLIDNHEVTLYGLCMNFEQLSLKKAALDRHGPLPPELLRNLEQWFAIELTYTSNAIEGNTLTRQETAIVVEKGLTVSGKTLVEHLEATNHARALVEVWKRARSKTSDLTERDILDLHACILRGIDDGNAGCYRSIAVRISGSRVVLPNPVKVPDLMTKCIQHISTSPHLHPVELAAEAHYRLVSIHPFVDGNGRTARLLMNLILLQNGYPPAIIRKRDRLRYIQSLEHAQLGGSKEPCMQVIREAVDRSLDIYVRAVNPTEEPVQATGALLRIGQLAKLSGETNATLRFWTREGLLEVSEVTDVGYHLYDPVMAERVGEIRRLQAERFTLKEIQAMLKDGG
jgi:fido (protein-threonine AMPylation protein)